MKMSDLNQVELLAPARDLLCGRVAIDSGADAVYIGGPSFGARQNAGNSIDDIAQLCTYAHQFGVKIYVTINTILTDEELSQAELLMWQLYEVGVDAFIVQDYGLLRLNLPPIPLHASTQMDTRTLEKAQFLESLGFQQIVLARELSLSQIKQIATQINVPIEAFVHGALCVSYSGQCYLSQALTNRSANRGECSQPCRLSFDLEDENGSVLLKNQHLLSLKDMNRSAFVGEMLDAGVRSFKIEGRLKDESYVRNVTAYYRRLIDKALQERKTLKKASKGVCSYTFEPNLEKTFHRGSTDYFLSGNRGEIWNFETPKSIGETIGYLSVSPRGELSVNLKDGVCLHNGDGCCIRLSSGETKGFRINRVDGNKLSLSERTSIPSGTYLLNRNFDIVFEKMLSKKDASTRRIPISIHLSETINGYAFFIPEIKETHVVELPHEKAKNEERAATNLTEQLGKLGDTIYELKNIEFGLDYVPFIPNSILSTIRRKFGSQQNFESKPTVNHRKNKASFAEIAKIVHYSFQDNLHNEQAKLLLIDSGAKSERLTSSFEKKMPSQSLLMTCRHCIRFAMGSCSKQTKQIAKPLFLRRGKILLRLEFDCKNCEMKVYR